MSVVRCLSPASPLMGAQSFPNLTTTGTTSTVTMSTSIVTSSNNVATATTGLSVGQMLSNTLTASLTSTSSESDTGQEAEFSLYGQSGPELVFRGGGDYVIRHRERPIGGGGVGEPRLGTSSVVEAASWSAEKTIDRSI